MDWCRTRGNNPQTLPSALRLGHYHRAAPASARPGCGGMKARTPSGAVLCSAVGLLSLLAPVASQAVITLQSPCPAPASVETAHVVAVCAGIAVNSTTCGRCVLALADALPPQMTTTDARAVWAMVECVLPLLPAQAESSAAACVQLLYGRDSNSSFSTTTTSTSTEAGGSTSSSSDTAAAGLAAGGASRVTAQSGVPPVMVAFSPQCVALENVQSGVFNTQWLPSQLVACLGGAANISSRPACDASCLTRLSNAVTAFTAAGCDQQYFNALAAQSPARGGGAAVAAAARADYAALAWLVTGSAHPRLACQQNGAGDLCLSFAGLVDSLAPTHSGLALLPSDSADTATQCAFWHSAGCCAPLVAALRAKRTQVLITPLTAGTNWTGQASDAALALEAGSTVAELAGMCSTLGTTPPLGVSTFPCGGADAFLAKPARVAGAPPPKGAAGLTITDTGKQTSPASAPPRKRGLSGGGVAGIVIMVLVLLAAACFVAFRWFSTRRARGDVQRAFQMHEFARL